MEIEGNKCVYFSITKKCDMKIEMKIEMKTKVFVLGNWKLINGKIENWPKICIVGNPDKNKELR